MKEVNIMNTEKETKERSLEEEIVRDCPILFQMHDRPMTETCMCWGFECNEGWHEIIGDAARQMEILNDMYYPKYRVRIQADQIKEKYGTLRFYYSVVVDPCKLRVWLANKFNKMYHYFCKFKYNTKEVVDVEPYDYEDIKEITKEEYTEKKKSKFKCSNEKLVKKDEKYYRILELHNYGKRHVEPTQYKLFWKLRHFADKMYRKLMYCHGARFKDNPFVRNRVKVMDYLAGEIVRIAEERCDKICEKCGAQIGTDWSPTCTTTGWVKNICIDCAEEANVEYYKNGELWFGNKRLKTKKQAKTKHKI